jgi:multicomponent Na+:H+ antiporter subunit G
MSLATDIFSILLLLAGTVFFIAGTVGLLRFPDVFTVPQAASVWIALKLILIWLLILLASSTTGHLLARAALRIGIRPWTKR